VGAIGGALRDVAFERTRVRIEVFTWSELGGIDKDADDRRSPGRNGHAGERSMPFVQSAHRGDQCGARERVKCLDVADDVHECAAGGRWARGVASGRAAGYGTPDCMNTPIYLDYAASTPVDPRVLDEMLPWFTERPSNTASRHGPGVQAAEAVQHARGQVARMLGSAAEDVIFVSGATESCNLAIKGLMRPRLRRGEPVHIISTAIEHAAVLEPLRRLEREGADIDLVPPTSGGWVDPAAVEGRLRDDTALVSVMWVNNELGSINDVEAIGGLCRDRGVLMHCDASQAPGKVAMGLSSLPLDAISVCAHKMYGPKGAGALVLQGRAAGRPLEPLIEGDGHERGLRSGTLDVPAIVGFGAAADLVHSEWQDDCDRIAQFHDELKQKIQDAHPAARFNGEPGRRVPHIINVTIPVEGPEPLVDRLSGIACTGGAACASLHGGGSHVLTAIGLESCDTANTIRLSLGRPTTPADIAAAATHLAAL